MWDAALCTLDVNAFMSFYFISQQYERNFKLTVNVVNDIKHASIIAIHATHLSEHEVGNHLKVKCSRPHSTAVRITLHLFILIRVSRSKHHSKVQYIHAKKDYLDLVSLTMNHRFAT